MPPRFCLVADRTERAIQAVNPAVGRMGGRRAVASASMLRPAASPNISRVADRQLLRLCCGASARSCSSASASSSRDAASSRSIARQHGFRHPGTRREQSWRTMSRADVRVGDGRRPAWLGAFQFRTSAARGCGDCGSELRVAARDAAKISRVISRVHSLQRLSSPIRPRMRAGKYASRGLARPQEQQTGTSRVQPAPRISAERGRGCSLSSGGCGRPRRWISEPSASHTRCSVGRPRLVARAGAKAALGLVSPQFPQAGIRTGSASSAGIRTRCCRGRSASRAAGRALAAWPLA